MARTTSSDSPPIPDAAARAARPTTSMRYTAVWEPGAAPEIQLYDVTYEEYRAQYDKLWGQGWRLKALQPTVVGGTQVRYTAVWRQSTAGETQVYGWTYEDFAAKYGELWAKGWRLKLLQPFVLSGDQVRYTAVWEQSTAGEVQVYGWTYEHFRAKYDELWKQGWRLKLLQPFVLSGSQVRYSAVWQQSTAGETQVYGWAYADFRAKYDELWKQGWRLKTLQTFLDRPAPPKIKVPPAGPGRAQLVERAVRAYQRSGGMAGPAGWPARAVEVTGREARWDLTGGTVRVTADGDDHTLVERQVKVTFVGLKSFEESGEWSEKDEPYVMVSWVGNGRAEVRKLGPFSVNRGDEVVVPTELVRDLPLKTAALHVAVYEHDEGSTGEATAKVRDAMQKAASAAQQAVAIYEGLAAGDGNTGDLGIATQIAGTVLQGPLGTLVATGLVKGLGLGDDFVQQDGRTLFGKDHGFVAYPELGRTGTGEYYTHRYWINSDGNGDYEVYLRVEIVRTETKIE